MLQIQHRLISIVRLLQTKEKPTHFFSFSSRQISLLNNTSCHTIPFITSVILNFLCGGFAPVLLLVFSLSPPPLSLPPSGRSSVGCRVGPAVLSVALGSSTSAARAFFSFFLSLEQGGVLASCGEEGREEEKNYPPQFTTLFSYSSFALGNPSVAIAASSSRSTSCRCESSSVC